MILTSNGQPSLNTRINGLFLVFGDTSSSYEQAQSETVELEAGRTPFQSDLRASCLFANS